MIYFILQFYDLKCDGLDGIFIDNPITFAPNNTQPRS